MKKILLVISLALIVSFSYSQAIYNNNARIVSTAGSYWVINSGDFTLISTSPDNLVQMDNLSISADASLTISANSYLTVNGSLSNNSGNDGLILQSTSAGSASLIQATNAVDATQQRYLTGNSNLQSMTYHLISVPNTPATTSLTELFTGAYMYNFNVASNTWNGLGTSTSTQLDETRGYMIYVPEANSTYSFTGPLNGGAFTALTTHAGEGFNLVPNPYPSAIDWNASSGWTKTNINNAIYIWPSGGSNYASYVDGVAVNGGSAYIPSGQSFFVKTSGSGPILSLSNSVRVHSTQPFYKSDEQLPNLLRIKATSGGLSDETIVRFSTMATNAADNEYDAWKLQGSEQAPQLFTLSADGQNLSINSLPLETDAHTIPLCYTCIGGGDASIRISNLESFSPTTSIHLIDLKNNCNIDLRQQSNYSFKSQDTDNPHRFNLILGSDLSTPEVPKQALKAWVSNHMLMVSSGSISGEQGEITIYNVSGQVLQSTHEVFSELNQYPLSLSGPIIIKIRSGENFITLKAILIN